MNTKYAENPISIEDNFQRGGIAIAVNGIPIFDPINASGVISKQIVELDKFGGDSGRGDDYQYHAAPLHLESTSGNLTIAYALDGYAVYGLSPCEWKMLFQFIQHFGDTVINQVF